MREAIVGTAVGGPYSPAIVAGDYACLTKLCGIGSNAKYGAWIYVHS